MNAHQFVTEVRALIPTYDEITTAGCSPQEAYREASLYEIGTKRGMPRWNTPYTITNLIGNYDFSKFNVYGIGFLESEVGHEGCTEFGYFDTAMLVMDSKTREIELTDYGEIALCHGACAKTPEAFLSALLILISNMKKFILKEAFESDKQHTKLMLYAATEAAGGDKYEDFYNGLLGCDDDEYV